MVKATSSGNFKAVALPEPQTVVARCYSLVDIGTVEEFFNNEPQGRKPKIYVTWEFPTLLAIFNDSKGEEPFVTGMEMTLSTNENSSLAKLIAQWRNKPLTPEEQKSFDVNQMVGKTAMISFIINRKKNFKGQSITEITNENSVIKFNGIMPKPKELPCPPMLNPEMIWDWDIDSNPFNADKFMKIPGWIRKKMKTSAEFAQFGYDPEEGQQSTTTATVPATTPKVDQEPINKDSW